MLCTFQVFLGAQAGVTLLVFSDWKSRIIRWLSWSVLTGAIGTVLCLASQNDGWIPVNKNLWYVYSYYIIDDSPSLTNIHLISLFFGEQNKKVIVVRHGDDLLRFLPLDHLLLPHRHPKMVDWISFLLSRYYS